MSRGSGVPAFVLRGAGVPATLDIDFVNNQAWNNGTLPTIASLLTCTRASTGYYTKADGALVSFLSNVLRYGTNGLLVEEARTNLSLRSQELDNAAWTKTSTSVVADTTAAPDGTTTADTVTFTTNAFSQLRTGSLTLAGATTYIASVYYKGTGKKFRIYLYDGTTQTLSADLTPTSTWQRATVSLLTGASPSSSQMGVQNESGGSVGDVILWGMQCEAGAFATSYIPTTSSSATRAADLDVSSSVSWLTQGVGTLYAAWNRFGSGGTVGILSLNDVTGNNRVDQRGNGTSLISNAGVSQASITMGTPNAGVVNKGITAYTLNDMAAVLNGGTVGTDASGTPPANATQLQFGGLDGAAGANNLGGYITRLAYWNSRLANATLQALTT